NPPHPPPTYPLSLHDALPICSAAEPETMPDQCGPNRKAGEHQRAQPCEQTRGHEASADELGKDSRSGESRRPWKPITFDLFDARSEEHTSELQSRGHLVCRLL